MWAWSDSVLAAEATKAESASEVTRLIHRPPSIIIIIEITTVLGVCPLWCIVPLTDSYDVPDVLTQ